MSCFSFESTAALLTDPPLPSIAREGGDNNRKDIVSVPLFIKEGLGEI